MTYKNKEISLGLLLQNAGLISKSKLDNALKVRKQYSNMNLSEILTLQAGIKPKTINFFAEQWQEIISQGKQFPLGYYLKKADLLSEHQIKTILQEQQSSQHKFGMIAVEKGWIEAQTVEFIVNSLLLKPPQIMSLNQLKEYNNSYLHLDKKYTSYSLMLSRVLAWTRGNIHLTKTICQIFADFDLNIPSGAEISAVDRFVENSLIGKWQVSKTAEYIRLVRQQLVNNHRCASKLLLEEYREILISDSKKYQNTKEQNELILLGLLYLSEDKHLTVGNAIYQRIFDRDFINRELMKLESRSAAANDSKIKAGTKTNAVSLKKATPYLSYADSKGDRQTETSKTSNSKLKNKPKGKPKINLPKSLPMIASVITLGTIAALIPLFIKMNSYYSSKLEQGQISNLTAEVERLRQFCDGIDVTDSSVSLSLISQLENNQRQFMQFPDNCEAALNRLRIVAAPVLGKESRILEAVKQLCKIPPDSEMYLEAEVWLKRWYNSPDWGEKTQLYLQDFKQYKNFDCPAARFSQSQN